MLSRVGALNFLKLAAHAQAPFSKDFLLNFSKTEGTQHAEFLSFSEGIIESSAILYGNCHIFDELLLLLEAVNQQGTS